MVVSLWRGIDEYVHTSQAVLTSQNYMFRASIVRSITVEGHCHQHLHPSISVLTTSLWEQRKEVVATAATTRKKEDTILHGHVWHAQSICVLMDIKAIVLFCIIRHNKLTGLLLFSFLIYIFCSFTLFRWEVLFSVTPHQVTLNIVDDDAVLFFVCLLLFLFFSQFDLWHGPVT